jgi:hypothetical protein
MRVERRRLRPPREHAPRRVVDRVVRRALAPEQVAGGGVDDRAVGLSVALADRRLVGHARAVVRRRERDLADGLAAVQPLDVQVRPAARAARDRDVGGADLLSAGLAGGRANPCSTVRSALPVSASAAVSVEDAYVTSQASFARRSPTVTTPSDVASPPSLWRSTTA